MRVKVHGNTGKSVSGRKTTKQKWWAIFRGGPMDGRVRKVAFSADSITKGGQTYKLILYDAAPWKCGLGRLYYAHTKG